ncbi:MAG: ribbon-helix-helix protein, CopG family [candidate division NC10 bacterium]|nr:ribbon-helix-helix protein, CopG family [candidate division NC10 bacterium]
MGRKRTVIVVLDAEVAEALKAEAEGRDRSMSWIVNRLLAAALQQPRRIVLEEVLPEDPDWEIIRARRHQPLANLDTYHRERLKKSGLRKRAVGD